MYFQFWKGNWRNKLAWILRMRMIRVRPHCRKIQNRDLDTSVFSSFGRKNAHQFQTGVLKIWNFQVKKFSSEVKLRSLYLRCFDLKGKPTKMRYRPKNCLFPFFVLWPYVFPFRLLAFYRFSFLSICKHFLRKIFVKFFH